MKIIEPRPTCYKCYRPKKACFCESIEPLKTTFEFRILIHPKEARVGHVGTGRVANQALLNSKIIIDATFDNNKEVQEILNSDEFFPMVLYPGENSHNISHDSFPESYFEGKTPLIFIIDGTWPCAKSMMRDSKCLHGLPRISFDSSVESKYSIRHQPAKYCLSTIESIYQVLKNLERLGIESLGESLEVLPASLDKIVEFQKKCAADPTLKRYKHKGKSGAYKDPSKRKLSKKWGDRKICFEEKNYY